jgi:undecaprenyl diphosphate synthase
MDAESHGTGPVPRHVAIIMDGNGRWAKRRGLPRFEGHRRGVEAVRRTVRASLELGVEYLTIFSFSSENWSRPAQEIAELLGLLRRFIRNDLATLHEQGVRIRLCGSREGLANDLLQLFDEAERTTRDNTAMTLVVAFNYGGRQEILRAVDRLMAQAHRDAAGPTAITPEQLRSSLDLPDVPDVDLMIRTSGEQRISNFLLWQAAYAELVFLPVLWPDFEKQHLLQAIDDFNRRERRFGTVTAAVAS